MCNWKKKRIHTESSGQQLLNIGGARVIRSGNESTYDSNLGVDTMVWVYCFLPPLLRGEFPCVSCHLFLSSSEETHRNIFKIQFYSGQQMEPRNHSADVLPLKIYRHLPISFIYLFIYLLINMKELTNPMYHSYRAVMPILIKLSELRMYCGTVSFTENFGRTTIK